MDSPNMGFVGFRLLKKVKDSPCVSFLMRSRHLKRGCLIPWKGFKNPLEGVPTPAGDTAPMPVGAEGRDAKYLVMYPTST